MDEVKKRRYPRDLEKLKQLAERLEYEIADRQEMLADVRRLKTEAENAEIVNTVKKYNVSLEELAQFFEERRNNVPGPSRILSKTEKEPSELFDSEGYVMETEENDDE